MTEATLYVYADSYAYQYAVDMELPFVLIKDEEFIYYLPGNLVAIDSEAFADIPLDKVYVPASVTSIADDATLKNRRRNTGG